jgi:hypothetical protein
VDPFLPSSHCATCHNGLTSAAGEEVSIGVRWRTSMMAHAARDPYWHAGVRREVVDHPRAQSAIEHECSRCHMPMAHVLAGYAGRQSVVFGNLAPAGGMPPDPLALEGVSCTVCHQIAPDRLGTKESFTGGFVIPRSTAPDGRIAYGSFDVTPGLASIMRTAVGFAPARGAHLERSELCATCHTLYTHALDSAGQALGEFPEQVPYQEWLHSRFRESTSCQDCHMPGVEKTPIASVLGEVRDLPRHDFRGANTLMLALLTRHRHEFGAAEAAELDRARMRTEHFLREEAAALSVIAARQGGRVEADVTVRNLAGHKLPTAYPSRRAWLHVALRDAGGRTLFSSGDLRKDGAIDGNDNDLDATRYEPHYREIRSGDQVQIYETVLGGPDGRVTTGLLTAVQYLKDNRVLPGGFDKSAAPDDVKVRGEAQQDLDFTGGEDRIRYSMEIGDAEGPLTLEVRLWYQPIAFRWARNLGDYDTPETRRFVDRFEGLAGTSAVPLAEARTSVR